MNKCLFCKSKDTKQLEVINYFPIYLCPKHFKEYLDLVEDSSKKSILLSKAWNKRNVK